MTNRSATRDYSTEVLSAMTVQELAAERRGWLQARPGGSITSLYIADAVMLIEDELRGR